MEEINSLIAPGNSEHLVNPVNPVPNLSMISGRRKVELVKFSIPMMGVASRPR